jgi:hypothetical protein
MVGALDRGRQDDQRTSSRTCCTWQSGSGTPAQALAEPLTSGPQDAQESSCRTHHVLVSADV